MTRQVGVRMAVAGMFVAGIGGPIIGAQAALILGVLLLAFSALVYAVGEHRV